MSLIIAVMAEKQNKILSGIIVVNLPIGDASGICWKKYNLVLKIV